MSKYLVILFIFLTGSVTAGSLADIAEIIKTEMEAKKIPALAVSVIKSGEIIHLSARGFRDIENNLKANDNTPFHLASISKIVTNIAVFKLIESGRINLEADVNNYLPFKIENPHAPNDIVTISEILTQSSGLKDDFGVYGPYWSNPMGDPKTKLDDFLKDYLTVGGKLYHPNHYPVGPSKKYSNTAYALLGLIVENVTGQSYEEFSKENIFEPLSMHDTSWFLKNLDNNKVAKTYDLSESKGLRFIGHNGYPDYPAGQLRSSISDFSKLIVGYLRSQDTPFILKAKTTKQITPASMNHKDGIYTWFTTGLNEHKYYFHDGSDVGVSTVIVMDVTSQNAIIAFANSNVELGELLQKVESRVF